MTKLIRLYIRKNEVEDISGIKNLENLDFLDAADNKIKDISELQYLPGIHLIGLSNNEIEDLLPLVNNPYLGEGVYLYIGGNPLSEKSINVYIPALVERGVTVYFM
jgi:Leucine-rich repeat (LRR) protein